MRLRRYTAAILLSLMLVLLAGCSEGIVVPTPTPQGGQAAAQRTVFAMDTVMDLKPEGEHAGEALDLAEARIQELESLLSVTRAESDIYAVNHAGGKATAVSQDTLSLLQTALAFCAQTDGALDVSIYPVLCAWGFTTESYQIPDADALDALLQNVDYTRVQTDEETGTVTIPEGMEIDLGSVAKGYTGDQVMEAFRAAGVTSGMISLGGNVQVLGTKPDGTPWRIAVKDPAGDGYVGVVEAVDQAVVTSGGYERFFEQDGVTYWHILDPATGSPAHSGVISATIVGTSGTMCDALSTAFFVMGPDRCADYWSTHEGFEYLLVLEDGSLVISEGLNRVFTPADPYAGGEIEVVSR